jgi:hypothetical protein
MASLHPLVSWAHQDVQRVLPPNLTPLLALVLSFCPKTPHILKAKTITLFVFYLFPRFYRRRDRFFPRFGQVSHGYV